MTTMTATAPTTPIAPPRAPFTVTTSHKDRLEAALRNIGHPESASAITQRHPDTLLPENASPTAGGCEAHFVDIAGDANTELLVIWTDESGCNLPTEDDYMASVYMRGPQHTGYLVSVESTQTA